MNLSKQIPAGNIQRTNQERICGVQMVQVMPPSFRFGKSKFFNKQLFAFQVFHHLLHRDIIVRNSRRFAVPNMAQMLQFNNESWLVCFCSPVGNSKWIPKGEIVCAVGNFQLKKGNMVYLNALNPVTSIPVISRCTSWVPS